MTSIKNWILNLRPGQKGVTLVELIIIMVVIGIAFPTIISPFLTSVKGAVQVETYSRMSYLASQHMELTLSQDHSTWWTALPTSTPTTVTLDGVNYTLSRTLTYVDQNLASTGGTPSSYIKIVVTISEPTGKTVSLQGLITQRA